MSRYKICFDGKWQEQFETATEAEQWAKEVADTGRMVYVARSRLFRSPELISVFPEEGASEGRRLWKQRAPWHQMRD